VVGTCAWCLGTRRCGAIPWLLNCANGTIDLRTGALREHRREDLLAKWTPVVYDKDAQCLLFTHFVGEIMGDDGELRDFLQRALGYSLIPMR
jgi:putative DNA primase/helicase